MIRQSHKSNRIIGAAVGVFIILLLIAGASNLTGAKKSTSLAGLTATVYRSATCGCCQGYIAYLRQNGLTVEEKIAGNDDSDLGQIKDEFNVPTDMRSCHTMRLSGYTIEGHVPIEAIEKLLAGKPAISGIALPGMPLGSPGMTGTKSGSFDVESFTISGSASLFMKV